ncbi:MAG: EAL domain-containing protein [Campylobacterota bacterium]|nr:EAL domain-containing protein [Campylobacterota bacterium]
MNALGSTEHKKKIDVVVALLLFFMLFLLALFVFLVKVDSDAKRYSSYDYAVSELKLADKSFDNFLLQQTTFVNYDLINRELSKFEVNMNFLNSKDVAGLFSPDYLLLLKNIAKAYKVKHKAIEYHKSKNALLLNSIHYLFDLNMAMSESDIVDKATLEVIDQTLLMVMKFYINPYIKIEPILDNILKLKLKLKKNSSLELEMFIEHIFLNVDRIREFSKLKKKQEKIVLIDAIDSLHIYLKNKYKEDILIERVIVTALFFIALVILVVLLIVYKRSLKMRDELLGFSAAVENSYNSIVITDIDSNITYVNDLAIKETGYTKEELIGQNPRVLKSDVKSDAFYKKMHEDLSMGRKWEGEFRNKRKDGSLFYEKASIMPIFQDGELTNYLAIKLNITDYIEEKQKVEHMVYHDALTSLPNRTNIENYLEHHLTVAKRDNSKIAILFIDLDRFKTINDTLGHDVGDELLVECAKRIRSALRESDMLARVGGDEFVVVLEALNDEYSAAQVCEKIIELFQKSIQTKAHRLNITLSIGISIFPDDAKDYTALFKYADVAMYEAKESGRNNFKYYKRQLSVDAHNRLDMEQALKKAVTHNELYLVYQPKYNILEKSVVGLEALVRWESEKIGFIPPDEFISVAEDTGDILEIGAYIFRQACEDFLIFQKSCLELQSISINISAVQLYQDSFVDDVKSVIKEVGIKPQSIMLEITESHVMKNVTHSMQILKSLKEVGFKISIDDFGTGHSSLSYLKLFPINELKIDKSFVDDLPDDQDDVAIARAIIALSQNMGYVNVAEGIETKEQEQFLEDNGCEIGQGYYFSKPQTKNDLINFFKKLEDES